MDLLAIVGVANVVGLVFKPILEDFAKDVLKDTARDYVKGCFGGVFSPLGKEPLQRALGKALRELLQLIQDELLDCGLTEERTGRLDTPGQGVPRSSSSNISGKILLERCSWTRGDLQRLQWRNL